MWLVCLSSVLCTRKEKARSATQYPPRVDPVLEEGLARHAREEEVVEEDEGQHDVLVEGVEDDLLSSSSYIIGVCVCQSGG